MSELVTMHYVTHPIVDCVSATRDASKLVEDAGRVCYMSYGKGRKTNDEYIANLIAKGHESVLEHAVATFRIEGVSRALTHELARHRHISISQLSQRYVVHPNSFVIPPGILAAGPDVVAEFQRSCVAQRAAYLALVAKLPDNKAGREAARAVLPNAAETKLFVTLNARAFRHIARLRGSEHADAEFRRLMAAWIAEARRDDVFGILLADLEAVPYV